MAEAMTRMTWLLLACAAVLAGLAGCKATIERGGDYPPSAADYTDHGVSYPWQEQEILESTSDESER